jgi:hypothetical protein
VVSGAVFLAAICMGCSGMDDAPPELDYTPTVKTVDDARAEARDLSSMLLDMTEIQGEVTQAGPGVSVCEADPDKERLFKMRHPFGISGVPVETLEAGMERLREGLSREGWEIIEDDVLNNDDRSPRILLENTEAEYAVEVILAGRNGDRPQLEIRTVSACFSTPEGQSPSGEY